jgi:energy-coupling factor transporter ATP-binding protein EcfA2
MAKWRTFTADFESPDLYVDWGLYSLVSSALQRRVWYGNTDPVTGAPTQNSIFLNQFIVLIGPPATGKGRIIKNVKAVCEHEKNKRFIINTKTGQQVLVTNAITCTPDNITFEGLFEFMAKPDRIDAIALAYIDKDGAKKETPYAHNSATACLEELGVMFTKNAEDVASVLCQAYDAGNLFRWTKTQGKDLIYNVCVNFLAGTTTDAVRRMVANKVVEEGLTTRVIFVYANKPRFYRFTSESSVEKQNAFLDIVSHINYLATKTIGEVKISPEGLAFMTEYYESRKMSESERVNFDKKLDGYYGRKKLHWIKCACVRHFMDSLESMTVSLETVKDTLAFLNHTELEMHLAFRDAGRNDQNETAQEVVRFLREHGECTYKKLFFNFFKDGDKQSFDEIMNYLEITEQVSKTSMGYKLNTNFEIK